MSPTLIYIIAGYLLILVVAYLVQERFIFKPEKLNQNFKYKYDAPFRELFFDVEPGVSINGLHFYVEKPLGLILYFLGKTLGSNSANYFSGTDEERLNELQAMLDDESIHAILCGRGGYGVSRIIDRLDFSMFKKKPKWIIGFSDITVLHAHIYTRFKIATMHAPMAAAFNEGGSNNEYIASLRKAIIGKKANYKSVAHPFNKPGTASGELIGGNLSLLVHLIGTPSDIKTKNKLLFIEDIGEMIYSSDRMLYQLKRSGKLDGLAGLIIGGFTDVKDTDRPFGKSIWEVINDIVKDYNYPVCFNFPVSHEKENYALKVGLPYTLRIGKKTVQLLED